MMNHKAIEYDYEAANYDKSRFNDNMGRHLDYMHKKILGSFIDSSGKLVLEAGIGTGRFSTWLAKKGFEVVGIDISREMLKKTKRKKALINVELSLVLADVNFLPFRERLFDSCICINVLDHLNSDSISSFFMEAKHAIKPAGSLIFNFSNFQSPYLPIAALINLRKQALFKSGRVFSVWLTLKEIDALLSRAGLNVKVIKGCMIASPVPFAEKLIKIISIINPALENSKFKLFCGSLFIKT